MNFEEMFEKLNNGGLDSRFEEIYGKDAVEFQKNRYSVAMDEFARIYGKDRDISLFSVSGRSELSGNHTDHNRGCVIAASIDLDIIAVASKRDDMKICVKSEGFPSDTVDILSYAEPDATKFGTSESIIAGMCKGFSNRGFAVGGFDAYTTSNVLKGSGLSSSAAFEDMIGNILSHMYNGSSVDNVEIAKIAQYSENVFFGKPCGLMDQVACAVGGIVSIDFLDADNPVIEKIDFDITGAGYNLCIVNTGGNHADLTDDYASVPKEMKDVAKLFGEDVLREVDENDVLTSIPALREKISDRAIMRALHFFEENKRVEKQKAALNEGALDRFFEGVMESGRSSFCYLQNVYTNKNVEEQGLSLALCLAQIYLDGKGGAFRVHGGGFAGTVQAYVKSSEVEEFKNYMDAAFGEGKCIVLRIRQEGAVKIA